jgi:hypothetical protein
MCGGVSECCRSGSISQDLIQQIFALKESEVLAKLRKVDPFAIRTQQSAHVLEVLGPTRVVDEPLQLEGDETFESHDPNRSQGRLVSDGSVEQVTRRRPARIEQVDALVARITS